MPRVPRSKSGTAPTFKENRRHRLTMTGTIERHHTVHTARSTFPIRLPSKRRMNGGEYSRCPLANRRIKPIILSPATRRGGYAPSGRNLALGMRRMVEISELALTTSAADGLSKQRVRLALVQT